MMDGFGSDLIFCIGLCVAPVERVHARRVNKAWDEAMKRDRGTDDHGNKKTVWQASKFFTGSHG